MKKKHIDHYRWERYLCPACNEIKGYVCTECGVIKEKPYKCIHQTVKLEEMKDEFIAKCIDSCILDVILAGKINEIIRYLNKDY